MQAVPYTKQSNNRYTSNFLRSIAQGVAAFALLASPLFAANTGAERIAKALPSQGSAPVASQYFAPTGKTVKGDFLGQFKRFGLERIGYPLSDEKSENGLQVQYFERVRMEYHPQLAAKGASILMTRLGVDISKGSVFNKVAAFKTTKTNAYIPETGHSLAEPFLSYWKLNGGLELYGYPISEALTQDGMRVQWFERARMEYHPQLAKTGKVVQLTHLGRIAYERAGSFKTMTEEKKEAPASPPTQVSVVPAQPQPPKEAREVPAAEADRNQMESYLLNAFNEQRAAAGLAPVRATNEITALSRARSGDMAERNYFSHTTPDGSKFLSMLVDRGIKYKFAGEILARNNYPSSDTARVALESYLNSPAHKAIIMDGRYNTVGIGYANSSEDGMHYYTVIFIEQ